MLNAIKAFLSIVDILLTLFRENQLKAQGRQEAMEEYRLKSIEAREKAYEIDTRPAPDSKHDILDRM